MIKNGINPAIVRYGVTAMHRVGKIINHELSSSGVWITCGLAIAILVVPRIFPLAVNFLWYDDFTETPAHYLSLYRFGSAADLAFWSWVFGPDYLRSYIPKLISIGYITVGVWALVQIFRAWKVPFVTALLAVLLFLISPILTEYLVWNDIAPEISRGPSCLLATALSSKQLVCIGSRHCTGISSSRLHPDRCGTSCNAGAY